jgi:hypothetical protein
MSGRPRRPVVQNKASAQAFDQPGAAKRQNNYLEKWQPNQ